MPSAHDSLFAEALPLMMSQFAGTVTVYPDGGQSAALSAIVSAVREAPAGRSGEDRTNEELDVTFRRDDWDEAGLIYPQKRWTLAKEADPDPRPWMFSHVVSCTVNLLVCRFTRTRLNAAGLVPQR